MDYAVGLILLLSFFILAWYCIKGFNLMTGFLIIAVIWTVLPLFGTLFVSPEFLAANPVLLFGEGTGKTPAGILNRIYQSAPENWGITLVNIFWGTWFGRVLMDTGIASTLIRRTVELGGDKPAITLSLLNLVTALIFTSMTGAGPVIAMAVIILPILISLGIPKAIAMFSFMGSVASGIYLNPVNFAMHRAFFISPSEMPEFNFAWYISHWGYAASVIMLAVTSVLALFYLKFRGSKLHHQWSAQTRTAQTSNKDAPSYTLILPILPVILNIAFNFPVIGGFVIAGFSALFLCGRMSGTFRENCQLVNKLYYDGVVDTAPVAGFMLTVPMFIASAAYASPYFNAVTGEIMPKSELAVCIVFSLLLLLGLFRGPMTLVGCGAATLAVLSNAAEFSVPFLFGVFVVPSVTVSVACCITQACTAWGLEYMKIEARDFLKLSIPNAYASGILQYIAVYFMLK